LNLDEFIRTKIESVDTLHVLLFCFRNADTTWTMREISVRLNLQVPATTNALIRLVSDGLLFGEGDPMRYRFAPRTPELARLVTELSQMDRERPVTLIKMIYECRRDIQAFADAFKLKKET
jgi:DNA-binding IclR family transcriptional regulator